MGLRFYRRFKILPGIRLNLSRSGVSASGGVRGAHVTIGPRGVRETVGIPGTGISYTTTQGTHQDGRSEAQPATDTEPLPKDRLWRGWLWLAICILVLAVALFAVACGNVGTPTPPVASAVPAPAPVRDTRAETYELQERCAKDAAAWYKHTWEDTKGIQNLVSNYTNHYNTKSGRCMLMVTSSTFGKTKETGVPYTLVSKSLIDVLENRDVAAFDHVSTRPQPMQCEFDGIRCESSQEWDALAKPYMEQ